jgi:hypothetical protein
MQVLAFALGFCAVAVLVYMARYSGRLRVRQTRLIDADAAAVRALVSDFGQWRAWCPWFEHEPEPTLLASTVGGRSRLAWSGARCGTGSVEQIQRLPTARFEQRLCMRTPFRYGGRSQFQFTPRGSQTEVTWAFRGRVGFAMRAFAPTVQAMIGLDLRYGLDRLARRLEGEAGTHYSLSYLGPRDMAAVRYAYATHDGPLDGLGTALHGRLAGLRQLVSGLGMPAAGPPIVVYLKTHIKRRTTLCQVGLPIGGAVPDELLVRELPAHRAYIVRVEGSPGELEVAWYQAMQRLRIEGLALDPRLPPYERYLHEAGTACTHGAVTELCMPLASGR